MNKNLKCPKYALFGPKWSKYALFWPNCQNMQICRVKICMKSKFQICTLYPKSAYNMHWLATLVKDQAKLPDKTAKVKQKELSPGTVADTIIAARSSGNVKKKTKKRAKRRERDQRRLKEFIERKKSIAKEAVPSRRLQRWQLHHHHRHQPPLQPCPDHRGRPKSQPTLHSVKESRRRVVHHCLCSEDTSKPHPSRPT